MRAAAPASASDHCRHRSRTSRALCLVETLDLGVSGRDPRSRVGDRARCRRLHGIIGDYTTARLVPSAERAHSRRSRATRTMTTAAPSGTRRRVLVEFGRWSLLVSAPSSLRVETAGWGGRVSGGTSSMPGAGVRSCSGSATRPRIPSRTARPSVLSAQPSNFSAGTGLTALMLNKGLRAMTTPPRSTHPRSTHGWPFCIGSAGSLQPPRRPQAAGVSDGGERRT